MAQRALAPYRVLDLADASAGYGTKLLADMGADVIKVEPPEGDRARRLPPFAKNRRGAEDSLYFAYMNTNKRSITLNRATSTGRALFTQLALKADVVYETLPPGHLDDLGIGYRQLAELNPKLVWVTVTPFGQTGPRRQWNGSDLVGWAMSGVLQSLGDTDRPPVAPGSPASLAYMLASLNAAAGALLALRARRRIGRGQIVDISIQEAAVAASPEIGLPVFLDDLIPRVRFGNRKPSSAPSGAYSCQDGEVVIAGSSPHHWDTLAGWIAERTDIEEVLDPLFRDRHLRAELRSLVDEWVTTLTQQYTKQAFFEEGQRRGVAVTPVNTTADITRDPHLEARNYWVGISHPTLGPLRMAGAPYRFGQTPWQPARAPLLGEHNESVYCGEIGLSPADLALARAQAVI